MELKDILKKINTEKSKKFDESVDVIFSLNLPKASETIIRTELNMPHQFGQQKKVLVLCEKSESENAVGADYVGLDEYIEKIKNGWKDFDVVIASPVVMPKIAILGKYLGSSGLMPNPKNGTVTKELQTAVKEYKSGKLNIKSSKSGQIQLSAGKKSMKSEDLLENIEYIIKSLTNSVTSISNSSIKSIFIKSSMGNAYRLS